MFKELHRNIKTRIITSFLSRVVGSMILPFMAIYFTSTMNAYWASAFLMIGVVIQFIAGLYGGYLADTLGRKKMLVTSGWMKLLGFIGMALANSPIGTSPWITFLMMIMLNVASGFENPAAEAMLIDVSTKETRAFMYSINYWAVNMSLMVGLIIGGWFYQSYFFELLIGLVIMSGITLWITNTFIDECYTPSKTATRAFGIKPLLNSYRAVIKDRRFILFTLGGIAILSLEFQRNNYIAIRLKEQFATHIYHLFHIHLALDGVRLLSILTVENTLIIVLLTGVVSKWLRNRSENYIMYVGFILFGLGYAWLAFSNNLLGLLIAVVILTVGELLYVPIRQTKLADIIDDTQRGAYMAFNGFVFQIGKLFGAIGIVVGNISGGIMMAFFYFLFALLAVILTQISLGMTLRKQLFTQQKSMN